MARTSNDYLKAIKKRYEAEKKNNYSSFLIDPSPAKLRDFCLLLLESGMSVPDQNQMANFFKPKTGETLHNCIARYDTEKLKAVKDFLTGKTKQTNSINLELIAILVNYQPRPFQKFLTSSAEVQSEYIEKGDEKEGEIFGDTEDDKRSNWIETSNSAFVSTKPRSKHKTLIFFLIAISLVTGGYMAKDLCFPTKQCMQWQEDHYEIVDCEVKGLVSISPIEPLDEDLLEFRKVELKKGMKFFKYKKPLYYYYKVSRDSIEFFNAPGLHPVTKKPLNEISPYIIDKYVK